MISPILGPVVALVAWSLVMLTWMNATRLPALKRAGISIKGRVGSRSGGLDGVVEDHVQWKAHNYNHLMEQPTIFYAIALSLALMGRDDCITLLLAWGYVAARVIHSLVQATVNRITVRLTFFLIASFCLLGLTISAALTLIGNMPA
ncbi:MAG: hypothetical protein JWN69_1782 [Alphaproteobacteria bacterium]|nr:hypothetical protein [Alphaproteobacteria bacterium]